MGHEDADAPAAVERPSSPWHLRAFDLRPITELQVATVDDADWATAWRDGYEVQRIGRLRIVPSWLETPDDGGVVVRLDPGMAFGTGIHPTTRGCLDMLQAGGTDPGRGAGRGLRVGDPGPLPPWRWAPSEPWAAIPIRPRSRPAGRMPSATE